MGIPMILCVSIFLLDRIDMILQVFEPQSREGAKDYIYFQIGTPVKYASLSFGI